MTNTLDELERLRAASAPGEWVQELTVLDRPELGADVVSIGPKTDGLAFFQARTTENAAAIVALHNAFPALLAYVRALEAVDRAARDRFNMWTRETYESLDNAITRLDAARAKLNGGK